MARDNEIERALLNLLTVDGLSEAEIDTAMARPGRPPRYSGRVYVPKPGTVLTMRFMKTVVLGTYRGPGVT